MRDGAGQFAQHGQSLALGQLLLEHANPLFKGRDLLRLGEEEMRHVRGREIGMIFQEPMTSLNPVLTIGRQLTEGLEIHLGMAAAQARARAVELLGLVGIPDGERRLRQYPHQFSGGMRQRMMIAMALACEPALVLADEPTTALDVTAQSDVMAIIDEQRKARGLSLLFITHDLELAAACCDRIAVMYAGEIVEQGPHVYESPQHPYTIELLGARPSIEERVERLPVLTYNREIHEQLKADA